jgi:hypothetical protein
MSRASLAAYGIAALARRPVVVKAAQIPDTLRAEFEALGVEIVSRILASPLTHSTDTIGVPKWTGNPDGRRVAILWAQEQRHKEDLLRRRDARRVLIGLGIGFAAVLIGLGGLIVAVLAYLH